MDRATLEVILTEAHLLLPPPAPEVARHLRREEASSFLSLYPPLTCTHSQAAQGSLGFWDTVSPSLKSFNLGRAQTHRLAKVR